MSITEKISKMFIKFILNNTEKSEEELEKIQYGFQVIIMNVFKITILFFTAYFLKVFMYTVIALIFFGVLRSFACGVHANSSLLCIAINYFVFLGNVLMSMNLHINKTTIAVLYILSLILITLYAPADTEERPLVSEKHRKSLKIKAIIAVLVFAFISLIINSSIYMNLIIISILEESISITPFAYSVLKKPYMNYKNVNL